MPKITFIQHNGEKKTVEAQIGVSVLQVAHNNNIELQGPCGGMLACGACHVIVDPAWFSQLPPPSEEEEDLLDFVCGVSDTSRMSCQIIMEEKLNGIVVTIPAASSCSSCGRC